jgi:GT2 family glycosyltransferase
MAGQLPYVDVVVVAWNQGRWLPACLESVDALVREQFEIGRIVVVDNASTAPVRATLAASTKLTVLTNATNRGFAAACNQAAGRGRGDLILFLNPDTRIHADALTRAVAVLGTPSGRGIGIVGLRLTDVAGVTQRTCGRFPGLLAMANRTLGLSRIAPARMGGVRLLEWPHDVSRDVDFACGAALLVRRRVFEALGGFDERLFLDLEDADLSLRARAAGWRTHFCADAVVEHACGWSTGDHRGWRLAHSWRSLLVYAWTHLPVAAALTVTTLVLTLAPLARLAGALVDRSWQGARHTAHAWCLLCRMLIREVAPRRPGAIKTPTTPAG